MASGSRSQRLWRLGSGPWEKDLAVWVARTTTLAVLACALLVGFATPGQHPAWCALLVAGVLAGGADADAVCEKSR